MPETIYVRRKGNSLHPCSKADEEALSEFAEGRDLSCTLTRPRSTRQHRFFWAILQKICHNHEVYNRPEKLLLWIKIRLGYVEEVRFHGDQTWWVAKSTSFNAMGQDEFRKFFDATLDCIVTEVIPGLDAKHLIQEVEEMLGFSLQEIWGKDHD
jgi:hypothetical protein